MTEQVSLNTQPNVRREKLLVDAYQNGLTVHVLGVALFASWGRGIASL
jgi:hypothetical protein